MERVSIEWKGFEIYIEDIEGMVPRKNMILVKKSPYYDEIIESEHQIKFSKISAIVINKTRTYDRVKFEYIKHIKKSDNPDDRVADFEVEDEFGFPDFDRLDRLIEKRKTKEERESELSDELYIKNECEKHGLEYYGRLRE